MYKIENKIVVNGGSDQDYLDEFMNLLYQQLNKMKPPITFPIDERGRGKAKFSPKRKKIVKCLARKNRLNPD